MKNILNRFGIFTGLIAAGLLATGCQSSKTACCTVPVNSSTAINGGTMVHVLSTNGFDWYLGSWPTNGTNLPTLSSVQTKASQAAMTPDEALAKLRDGNARFVAGRPACSVIFRRKSRQPHPASIRSPWS